MIAQALLSVSLLAAAQAITITAPTANAAWDFSQTNTIEWTSVSTDPSNFSIVLVDNNSSSGTPTQTTIKDLVSTADDKYSFADVVATPGAGYQIRFVGTTASDTGIIAQSPDFNVTKSGTAAANTTSASTPSPTGSSAPAATSAKGKNGAGALVAGAGLSRSVAAVALCMLL